MSRLTARIRTQTGKEYSKQIRRQGEIPAVLYGKGKEPASLIVKYAEIRSLVHTDGGSRSVIDMTISGSDDERTEHVMIKEIQQDPVKDTYTHIDFLAIDMNKPIKTKVMLNFVGEPIGVDTGGIFQSILREVEIECLPKNLPEHLDVDVSGLETGHALTVGDIRIPEGSTLLTHIEETIATVTAPATEAAAEEGVGLEEEGVEPKLVGQEPEGQEEGSGKE